MSFLNKRVEDSIKQAKLLAQMSEMSYRSLNGTRQTRSSFTNNDLKEQPDTDKPALGSLTSEMIAQYKREEEEKNKYVDPKSGDEFLYADDVEDVEKVEDDVEKFVNQFAKRLCIDDDV